jgi:hypothetical protein
LSSRPSSKAISVAEGRRDAIFIDHYLTMP